MFQGARMRFKGFDLNHLVALDHLLTERSVSHAADKLLRTQSTVSGILGRLRDQFGDDLLVQVGRDMVPTARGQEPADVVRDLLLRVDATRILPLRIVEARFGIPPLTEAIRWHQYGGTDRALMWVRDRIVDSMSGGVSAPIRG